MTLTEQRAAQAQSLTVRNVARQVARLNAKNAQTERHWIDMMANLEKKKASNTDHAKSRVELNKKLGERWAERLQQCKVRKSVPVYVEWKPQVINVSLPKPSKRIPIAKRR